MSKLGGQRTRKPETLYKKIFLWVAVPIFLFSLFGCSDPTEEDKFTEEENTEANQVAGLKEESKVSSQPDVNLKPDFHFTLKGAYPGITLAELRDIPFDSSELSRGNYKKIELSCPGDDFTYLEGFGIEVWSLPFSLRRKLPHEIYLDCRYTGIQTERIFYQDKFWNGSVVQFLQVGFGGHLTRKWDFQGEGKPLNRIIYKFFPQEAKSEEEIRLAQIAILIPNDWYQGIFDTLVEKYGEPTNSEMQVYENSFGREFYGNSSYWIGQEQTLALKEYQDNISQSFMLLIHNQLANKASLLAEEIEKNKTKKDAEDF